MTREIPEGPAERTAFVVEAMRKAVENGYSSIDFASGAIAAAIWVTLHEANRHAEDTDSHLFKIIDTTFKREQTLKAQAARAEQAAKDSSKSAS